MAISGFDPHFTFDELTNSEDHPSLVLKNRIDANSYLLAGKRLSKLLGSIRHILGDKAIKVDSGFRNEALNIAVKSKAENSKHKVFEACDIIPSAMSIKEAFNTLMLAHNEGLLPDLRKVLMEGTWLHIEVSMTPDDYRGFFISYDGNINFHKVA